VELPPFGLKTHDPWIEKEDIQKSTIHERPLPTQEDNDCNLLVNSHHVLKIFILQK
jgi:hypothetical protein